MFSAIKRKYLGSRSFYASVLTVLVPLLIQNVITNFVSLLDNIMVGQIGTEQMSGVSIANQLLFVFNLCIFGGLSGAGIFTAQYVGKGDTDGIRSTVRFKLLTVLTVLVIALVLFLTCDEPLIGCFLTADEQGGDLALTFASGREYLKIMLFGLPLFALTQVYTSTLRENGETKLPMMAGIIAVSVNLCFNWLLIGGHLGFPALGIRGAAIATVLSRIVEAAIVFIWSHAHSGRFGCFEGLWRTMRVPFGLTKKIIIRGMPLLFNEAIWSFTVTAINQCYSTRGIGVVAAVNIASTAVNLFSVFYLSLGTAVGIIVGQILGRGEAEEAVDANRKLTAMAIALSVCVGAVVLLTSPFFPRLYNTEEEIKRLASFMICVAGVMMPAFSYFNCCYFTLRCGGRTGITFVFDSLFKAVIHFPAAYALSRFTAMDIRPFYALCTAVELIKVPLGYILIKKRVWVHTIVGEDE